MKNQTAKFQRFLNVALVAAATAAAVVAPQRADAKEYIYGILAPETHPAVSEGVKPLFEWLEKETKGAMKWSIAPNGQLLTGSGTLPGLRDGIADGGYLITPYARSSLPNTNFIGDLFQFGENSLAVAAATTETVLMNCPQCIEEFRKNNVVWFIGSGYGPSKLLCKTQVKSLPDVKGLKIKGTGGVESRWIDAMGGVPLNMTMPDAVVGIERGTINCMIGPQAFIRAYGLFDVIRYVPDATMGIFRTMSMLSLNRGMWKGLPKDQKALMMKGAARATARFTITGNLAYDAAVGKKGIEKGISFSGGADIDALRREHRVKDRAVLITDAKKRGVKDADKLLEAHLADLKKWEAITKGMGDDVDKFSDAIWREIYSKLDPDRI